MLFSRSLRQLLSAPWRYVGNPLVAGARRVCDTSRRRASSWCGNTHSTLARCGTRALMQASSWEPSGVAAMDSQNSTTDASTVLVQNLVHLCSDLRLPVAYKVTEAPAAGPGSPRTFFIIVHVLSDSAFKKYLQHCSQADLLLFRGLLLKVTTDASISVVHSAEVQQAFLPKFENEGQDSSIADAIVAAADEHFMVATIKHSGSLVTLSGVQGFAAKNSLNNEFTAGAAVLLQSHYERVERGDAARAQARLAALMADLRSRHMALSFEMVTGSHGHHGQLPAAEYLVTTSAHCLDPATGRPEFLSWPDFMTFCTGHCLPVNDTWLLAGRSWAGSARDLLDDLALKGGPTAKALHCLTSLVSEGRSAGCLYLPGTYPHDQWQGSRIEGFVVSQGQKVSPDSIQALEQLLPALHASVLPCAEVTEALQQPYRSVLQQCQGNTEATLAAVAEACRCWLPSLGLSAAAKEDKERLLRQLEDAPLARLGTGVKLPLPSGGMLYSRAALAVCPREAIMRLEPELLQGDGGGDAKRQQQLRELLATVAAESGAPRKAAMVQLLRALAGAPPVHTSLRYKKKMMMWSLAPEDPAAAGGDGAESIYSVGGVLPPSSQAVMGYCMMTFVIRNGLKALALGKATYFNYVANLVRNWGLPQCAEAQVHAFAVAWAGWVEAHGGAGAVSDRSYLDQAEPFVAEFLRCRGQMAGSGAGALRPEGSFQGVLVLVDAAPGLAEQVQARLHAQHLLQPGEVPLFSRALVAQGAVVESRAGTTLPPKFAEFAKAAAPHMFVGLQRLGAGAEPNAKKQTSAQMAKRKVLEAPLRELTPAPAGAPPRLKFLDAPSSPPSTGTTALDALATQVQDWLGEGAPLQAKDPGVICCFVTIPGTGKTVLTNGLQAKLQAAASQAAAEQRRQQQAGEGSGVAAMDSEGPGAGSGQQEPVVAFKVLNSDTMKAKIKNFKVNRYWPMVGEATDSYLGGGSCTLVVADKNLVPSPKGNLERVLGQLSESGATTFAVLPYCAGVTSQTLLPQLYQDMPEVPMPLEYVALCMLRVLQRKGHEGGLDAGLDTAMTVVAMFVSFYWGIGLSRLKAQVQSLFGSVLELQIMTGLGGEGGPEVKVSAKMEELLSHIALGVSTLDSRAKLMLPHAWEQRARQLLLDPEVSRQLLALQRPLGELQAEVAAALGQALLPTAAPAEGQAAGDASAKPGAPVRWIGIAGLPVEQVLEAADRLPLDEEVKTRVRAGRPNYHVTLWHMDDPGAEAEGIKEALLGAVGQEAVIEVSNVFSCPEVTAAQVRMLAAPDEAMQKAFHHITLAVAPKSLPKDANTLPSRVAAGTAQQFALPEPIQLVGQILAFTQG